MDNEKKADEIFCSSCGQIIKKEAEICPKCGVRNNSQKESCSNASPLSRTAALLFCIFLGWFGAHRFYVGKIGTGILYIFTLGGFFGIGAFIDFILIIAGTFRDAEGKKLIRWQ